MRRSGCGWLIAGLALLSACGGEGHRVSGGIDTTSPDVSLASTEPVTTESSTTEFVAAPSSTVAATTTVAAVEPRALEGIVGLDGTVWDVQVEGVLFGDPMSGGKGPKGCAVVVGSVRLHSAPGDGAWPTETLPMTLSAGVEPVQSDMFGACWFPDAEVSRPRGFYSFLLVGSSMPFALTFISDELDGRLPAVLAVGADQAVEVTPPVVTSFTAPSAATSGPLNDVVQPAEVETEYTWQAGTARLRQAGVLSVPTEDGWCVVVMASVTVVSGGFSAYFNHPNISVLVDGHMESPMFGGPPVGECAELDDGWRQDPTRQNIPDGTVFGVASIFIGYTSEPTIQAVALPSGTEGESFEWIYVEPIILDSPPDAPS